MLNNMLIPVSELVQDYNVKPSGILHVGAHVAEESIEYEKYFNVPVLWIEAQPKLCLELKKILNPKSNTIVEACIFDKNDELLTLNVSSNSQSTSILNFGTHADVYPDVFVSEKIAVRTKRLDKILEGREIPDFINLDIQGTELNALKSLGDLINKVQVIYTEVNKRHLYEGCNLVKEMDEYLKIFGFKRITTRWMFRAGWGDALYVSSKNRSRSFRQFVRSQIRLFKYCIIPPR
jgi:FkbM family methyltransferase